MSGVIYYDFIENRIGNNNSDRRGAVIMKFIILIFGIYCLVMAPFMSKVKYLLQIAYSINGTLTFVNLSFICLGTSFPKISTRAALFGIFFGFIFINWIAIGATFNNIADLYKLPLSTHNFTNLYSNTTFCPSNFSHFILNKTEILSTRHEPFILYKLSFMYYPLFGLITSIGLAYIFSFVFGFNDMKNLDSKLIIPYVQPKKNQLNQEMENII